MEAKIYVNLECPGKCGGVLHQTEQGTLTCLAKTCSMFNRLFQRPTLILSEIKQEPSKNPLATDEQILL